MAGDRNSFSHSPLHTSSRLALSPHVRSFPRDSTIPLRCLHSLYIPPQPPQLLVKSPLELPRDWKSKQVGVGMRALFVAFLFAAFFAMPFTTILVKSPLEIPRDMLSKQVVVVCARYVAFWFSFAVPS